MLNWINKMDMVFDNADDAFKASHEFQENGFNVYIDTTDMKKVRVLVRGRKES